MFYIGICDDGKNICASVETMLLQCAKEKGIQIETFVWYTGEGLKEYLERGNQLHILFLDIELLQMSGIEVGRFIRTQLDDMGMQIIYISGKVSYAPQLFKTQPLDFLVKPVTKGQISEALEAALKVIRRKNEKFEFRKGKDYYYVPMGDIVYFVSEGRKVKIVTMKETFEFYGRLKETAGRLPESFVIIHKSYIVNQEYIFRYSYETVELVNGIVLTVSPANRKRVREKILRED